VSSEHNSPQALPMAPQAEGLETSARNALALEMVEIVLDELNMYTLESTFMAVMAERMASSRILSTDGIGTAAWDDLSAQHLIGNDVSLFGVDDHEARAKLMHTAKPPEVKKAGGIATEKVAARGAQAVEGTGGGTQAVEGAQKRVREARKKVRALRVDIEHHEKQARLHTDRAKRKQRELDELESEGTGGAPEDQLNTSARAPKKGFRCHGCRLMHSGITSAC